MTEQLNGKIIARGKEMFTAICHDKPSLFVTGSMLGRLMEWAMQDERFRTRLFRFVDVFPSLKSGEQLSRHVREYFGKGEDLPPLLSAAISSAGMLGSFGGTVLSAAISANIHEMAKQFIIGDSLPEAVRNLGKLRRDGFAFVVDLLGEATLSHEEARSYADGYRELLLALQQAAKRWHPLPGNGSTLSFDWGDTPLIHIAVKPSALYCLANPRDFTGSVEGILENLVPIVDLARKYDAFVCIDMEHTGMKGITLEVYRRLKRLHPDYPWIGLAMQSYLRDTDRDLAELLSWAKSERIPIAIRLVKGAYWDFEMIRARQNNWPPPVWSLKAETDAAYERHARMILENHAICHFACASHNIRSIAAALEMAADLAVPTGRYEFQVLYGMAEPVRRVLLDQAGRIRLYAPYGEMVPGMGYLVRRLLENTANSSFLRRTFAEETASDTLLENPETVFERQRAEEEKKMAKVTYSAFRNEPVADFTHPELAEAFRRQLSSLRHGFGAVVPLLIDGNDVTTANHLASVNPADPREIVGSVCLAGPKEVAEALRVARNAFPRWRDTPSECRVEIMRRAAAIIRERLVELAALQVLEAGKQWDQAYADVTEAIDFLEFYSLQMLRLAEPPQPGQVPGEINRLLYEPCGVAAVIAPWNFPLAISCGMTAAALVTGNSVVYKPSSLTPLAGRRLAEIYREAGIPAGVFNFLPCSGASMGDHLVTSTELDLVAFTGSSDVGLGIVENCSTRRGGQRGITRVICEMGGKNAAIVDDDADLDEAIPQILQAAFGYQGQKCSACSRVIVLEGIYEQFVARFVRAAASLSVGPAENPAFSFGPVVSREQQQKIRDYIDIGKGEGKLLYLGSVPEGEGYYVPLAIFADIHPEHRLAREEIFGPVLAIMRAGDFTTALTVANSTPQALTGSVFSRSPANLERAAKEFRVGNLYLNRACTGALVERHPFGGFRLSGGGTKAGGSDYLLSFMTARVVTENTMRRGFAPHG